MQEILMQLFIFLASSAICVPIAKRFGFSSVLGYLVAGMIIGPYGLSMIGEVEELMHFTEFGIVMMLFIDGLELKPSLLWQMKTPILGMGGFQVVLTTFIFGIIASFFVSWPDAIGIGLILSLSSTAIIIQTMRENGLMHTSHGKSVFSVLLFHDLAVIPLLAFLPLPAIGGSHSGGGHHFDIHALEPHMQIFVTLLVVLFIFLIGKYISRPMFRAIAATRVREIFVAAAIGLIVGISLLMSLVGLSPALGAFIAGVVLADSEYRHEIESDIEPFKGLLLGVFFISIGASLNFKLIEHHFVLIGGITVGLIAIKWLILTITAMLFKMERRGQKFFALVLAQGGEFAFVLLHMSKSHSVLPHDIAEALISAVAISIIITPFFFWLYEKFTLRKQEKDGKHEADEIEHHGQKVILAGFGKLGTDLGRFLISAGIKPVILDNDAANVDLLRKFGFEVYYGDSTRLDLLEAAGIGEAELLLITVGNLEKSRKLVELVKKHYPRVKIAVSAKDRTSAYELMDLGINEVRREKFGTALSMGQDALKLLGTDPYEAYRLMRIFRKNDDDMTKKLYKIHREDEDNYISMYHQHMSDLEELMQMDQDLNTEEVDKSWTACNPEL